MNQYCEVRCLMRPGDVISFLAPFSPISWFAPRGAHKCDHVASVVTSPDLCRRRLIIEATGKHGVKPATLSVRLDNHGGQAWWHRLIATDEQRSEVERFLWEQLDKEYDFGGVLRNIGAYVSEDLARLFCSELVAAAIRAGIPLSIMDANAAVEKFLAGKALRPWDVIALPVFEPAVRIL